MSMLLQRNNICTIYIFTNKKNDKIYVLLIIHIVYRHIVVSKNSDIKLEFSI